MERRKMGDLRRRRKAANRLTPSVVAPRTQNQRPRLIVVSQAGFRSPKRWRAATESSLSACATDDRVTTPCDNTRQLFVASDRLFLGTTNQGPMAPLRRS